MQYRRPQLLLTGATGFIGRALTASFLAQGWQVIALVRDYAKGRRLFGSDVRLVKVLDEIDARETIDVVVNLAGAGIAGRRWSRGRKRELLHSRLRTTRSLTQLLRRLHTRPRQLLSASAAGYYEAQGDLPLDEHAAGGAEFPHELCRRWEEEARKAEALDIGVCIMRLGVVLAADGGMLGRLLPLFRAGLGGRIGDGQQCLSWIHRDDVLAAIHWLIANDCTGVYNLTAPFAVSNQEFTRQLAAALRRPAGLTQPAFMVHLALGEMGDRLLLQGARVVPARLQSEGFRFCFPTLDSALVGMFCDLQAN